MKRIILYSILIFVFSIGIGYYYSSLWKKENISIIKEENSIVGQNMITESTVSTEETVSYNASFALKKYYSGCGHYEINYAQLPVELVNLTEKEVENLYSDWEIEKFSKDEIILSQNIDKMCNDHYVLKLGEDNIEVYHVNSQIDDYELFKSTNISKEYLTNQDITNLENGIYVYGIGNLNSALEDFE